MKMKNCKCLIILMCLLAALGQTAIADDSESQGKNWEFNLAPFYLWGVTIDGDVTVGTNTVAIGGLPAFGINEDWAFYLPVNYVVTWGENFDSQKGQGAFAGYRSRGDDRLRHD